MKSHWWIGGLILSLAASESVRLPYSRGGTPSSPAVDKEIDLARGVKIPLRDKIELSATIYRPRGQAQRLPVIVSITPYGVALDHDQAMYFARHDYVFVLVDARGRGTSGGEFEPFTNEGRDGYDVVEWLARQPWCNGKVGMWGGSYPGFCQWSTLKELPPHLTTIVPMATSHAGVDFPGTGNIFMPYHLRWFALVNGKDLNAKLFLDEGFWNAKYREHYRQHLPFAKLDELVGKPSPHFQKWLKHRIPDAYWDAMVPSPRQYAQMEIPILTTTGQYDGAVRGAMAYYQRHMQHGSDTGRAKHYLLFGPWSHYGIQKPNESVGGLRFGKASLLDMKRLHKDWYDWTMKGGQRPAFLETRVAYYVTGAEEWKFADSLEAIPTRPQRLYLHAAADSTYTAARPGKLAAEKPGNMAPAKYRYDPLDLRPAEAAMDDAASKFITDQQRALNVSGNGLVYQSEPFEATEITGHLKFTAWIVLDVPDTDFQVTLYEIKPDGGSVLLAEDLMRARYRTSLRKEVLVKPGEKNCYEFTAFPFFSRRLEKGSRLRLVFASPNTIHLEKNYNSGGEVALETKKDARVAHVVVHQDGEHSSYLEIPVVRVRAE